MSYAYNRRRKNIKQQKKLGNKVNFDKTARKQGWKDRKILFKKF